jgi:phospholipid/cholesterol/gamma-HCH transport system permease protein
MLDISPGLFIAQTRGAVSIDQVVFGLTKSFAFGALIALAGCRIGLKAGRSATDVGHAATRAVVVGIIVVIMLDTTGNPCSMTSRSRSNHDRYSPSWARAVAARALCSRL